MAKPRGPVQMWSQYLALRTAAAALTAFDPAANLRSASLLGKGLHRFDHRHRERAQRSIAMAFPDRSEAWVRRVTRESFEHVAMLGVELFHSPRTLGPYTWTRHVGIRDIGPAIELLNRREPMILLTGHVGNWEVMGNLLACLGYDLDALARPIDNPLADRWLMGIREKRGMRVMTKFDASSRMVEVLDRGGALAFIADQNAGEKGLFVPFFHRLASCYKSIGLLAINRRVPIVCGCAHRLSRDLSFEVFVPDVIHPHEWESQSDPLLYITARYSRAIELMVRRRPEQYLWAHRRWKSRPRFERQGKPMPESLREGLMSLPWVDEAELESLGKPLSAAGVS
jgi:Kdo2-lipid IVA lauroyltransferase/acyltransferase